MRNTPGGTFSKGESIGGRYTVLFFVKHGDQAETYRVKDQEGKTWFLKLFSFNRMHRSQFDHEGKLLEGRLLSKLFHPNLVTYHDDGELVAGQKKYAYLVLHFISGETLADRLKRESTLSIFEAKQIISGILDGLHYLHTQSDPVIHNDLNHLNIMADLSGPLPVPRIIDFGHARTLSQPIRCFLKEGINPFFMAPECFNQVFSPQSDLFSVGAVLYHLIYGLPPWHMEISGYKASAPEQVEEGILLERRKPLKQLFLGSVKGPAPDANLLAILKKAMHQDPDRRFADALEMKEALNQNAFLEVLPPSKAQGDKTSKTKFNPTPLSEKRGFKQIAGMEALKELLQTDVIRALNEPEVFEKYGLTIPNGILLFGPPGCGKTFFAEKLAEEVGFNFVSVKPSDLASIYVHGAQEKIGQLFREARENAPTILFFDEMDALIPNRDREMNHSYASEVNEFLAQMTNCSKHGIFIIGATNRPEMIDPAILRTGRLDKLIYVPPPDFEARKSLFELKLKDRPLDFGINYDILSQLTPDFVSSDIEFLVNEAARTALRSQEKITQEILEAIIRNNKPSVSKAEVKRFEVFRDQLAESGRDKPTPPPIGFFRNDD